MLFKTFIKTTLQSIAAIIPIVTPIIILLLFISFILHKFLFIKLLLFLLNHLKILQCLHNCTFFIFWRCGCLSLCRCYIHIIKFNRDINVIIRLLFQLGQKSHSLNVAR